MNDILLSILSSIGGTTVILGALFGWLGKRYLEKTLETDRAINREKLANMQKELTKEIESHKNQLKYDEKFFNSLFDASINLNIITKNMVPKKGHPEMDWSEACEGIAQDFTKNENELESFLKSYYTPLPPEIVETINSAISFCSEGNFEVNGPEVSRQGRKLADELFEAISSANIKLKSHVDDKRNVNPPMIFNKKNNMTNQSG